MNKKYKKIPLILMGLSGVALLTSGFSTWVISVQATQTISNINFNGAYSQHPVTNLITCGKSPIKSASR